MAARRCSLLSARQLRPMRESAPVMRRPGRPSRRGSRSAAPFLRAIVCGAGTDTPRNRGDCWTRRRRRASLPSCPGPILLVARALALGALALVAVAAVVILFVRGAAPPAPSEALDPFVAAWSRGDDRGAAALTSDPAAAAAALAANRRGLDGARVQASTQDVAKSGDTARATVRLSWDVPGIGAWTLPHAGRARAPRRGTGRSSGRPTVVHPRLTAGRRLGTVRDPDARAPILDRQGRPLVTARQVVRIGLDRATVKDVDASAAALAGVARTSTPPPSRAPPSAPGPSSSSRR